MDKTKKTFSDYKKAKHDAFEHKSQFLRVQFMRNLFLEVSQFCYIFSAIIFPTEILPRGQVEHTICSSMRIREQRISSTDPSMNNNYIIHSDAHTLTPQQHNSLLNC